MTDLFNIPSRRFEKLARGRLTAKGFPEYNDNQARGRGGKWTAGGGKGLLRGGARVGIARTFLDLIRGLSYRNNLRGELMAGRAAAAEARERVVRLANPRNPYAVNPYAPLPRGGAAERDAVRHIRQAMDKDPSFMGGVRSGNQIVDDLARRQILRNQGIPVRPLSRAKRRRAA